MTGVGGVGAYKTTGCQTFNFTQMMNQINGVQTAQKKTAKSNGVFTAALGRDETKWFAQNYSKAYLSYAEQLAKYRPNSRSGNNTASGKKESDYNHKKYPSQIRRAKSPQSIRMIASKIRAEINDLYQKLNSGEYDEEEVMSAILHAEAMEEAALKRADNLEKEQIAERKEKRKEEEERVTGEKDEAGVPLAKDDPLLQDVKQEVKKALDEEMRALQEKMQKELERALEEDMEELTEDMEDVEEADDPLAALDEMAKVLRGDMSKEDIDLMKKKHRAAEEMDLTRADMEYLKAKFNRLQRQKDAINAGAGFQSAQANATVIAGAVQSASLDAKASALKFADASGAPSGGMSMSSAPTVGVSVDVSG